MLRWLNVSEAAAKIATSVDAGAMRALEPASVRHERRVARRRARRAMPAKTSRRVGHLRHPLRADERA